MSIELEMIRQLNSINENLIQVCNNTQKFTETFPKRYKVLFMSTTANSTELLTPSTFIPNTSDGYLTELERLGQAGTSVGTSKSDNVGNNPYSINQRCLSDQSSLLNGPNVLLRKIEWFAYDTTLNPAGTGQTQSVITKIVNSKTTDDILAQSGYKNGMMPIAYQPNYFRPELYINGINVLEGLASSDYGTKKNLGDLSIGLPLPYCEDFNSEVGIINQPITSYAQVAQLVDVAGVPYYQRYPVLTVVTLSIGNSYTAI